MAEPAGLLLHASRSSAGLFPSTSPGKQAAQRALDEQLLQSLDDDPRLFVLSDRGLDYLLQHSTPRTVLEDLVRALEARQTESVALVADAARMKDTLESLGERVVQVLHQLPSAPVEEEWTAPVLAYLERRLTPEDCPLPELYLQARLISESLSIGGFHDGLRRLHENGSIYLHPWTGPLYALPEPSLALLIGHEIAYYASPRQNAESGTRNGEQSLSPHSGFRVSR
jgi:hypothetical protein